MSLYLTTFFLTIGITGVFVLNFSVLGMARELRKISPAQADRFRWYKVLGLRTGADGNGVSDVYREHYGQDAKYAKLAKNGWRLFLAGFGFAILSSLFGI